MSNLPEIPTTFYIAIGVLIFTNFGVILTLLTFIFKAGIFVANTNSGIQKAQETGNRAHVRLTKHEELYHGKSL